MRKGHRVVPKNYFKLWIKNVMCFSRRIQQYGRNVYLSPLAEILNPKNIVLGDDVVVERHARLCANGPGALIKIGDGTTVLPFALLKTNGGKIEMGRFCSLNDYAIIYGFGGVHIGDDVHIASHAVIVASEHYYDKLGTPDFSNNMRGKGIRIEDSVWIGAHAVVLDGVRIGTHSVIGAGAVVAGDIPSYSVAVGVPAKVIKKINENPARSS